ncbi:MAG TPA: hypothetical protein VJ488_00680 [Dehalococcoidia bacterium]|nr:hypothetical protein [Dehalococcoidia bacterium]
MNERLCNLMEPCKTPEAPLCPLQMTATKNGIWYGDEPVCQCELYSNLPWIRKQKIIAALGLKADAGFFTVSMLNSLRAIAKNLTGADPDDANAESKWLGIRRQRNSTRKSNNPVQPPLRKKRAKISRKITASKRLL